MSAPKVNWNDKERVTECVKTSKTYRETLAKLGLNSVSSSNASRLKKYLVKHNIQIDHFEIPSTSELWRDMSDEKLNTILQDSYNYSEALRNLGIKDSGGNVGTLKKYIDQFGCDVSHFDGGKRNRRTVKKELKEIMVKDSTYNTTDLKRRLIKESIIENKCIKCGNEGNWLGNPLMLQLEHKNGNPTDHRLCNLEILCPNCHTQTKTWGNKKR